MLRVFLFACYRRLSVVQNAMRTSPQHQHRLLVFIALIMLTASCADASAATASPTVTSGNTATVTPVAPRLVTLLPLATTSVSAPQPSSNPTAISPQPTQLQQGVTLNLNGVATKVRGQRAPAAINKLSYIDLDAVPEHLRVLFDNDAESTSFNPRTRQLLIIPLTEYGRLFGPALAPQFNDALSKLQAALKTPNLVAQHGLTLLPTSGLQHALTAQVRVLSFSGGSGVRFVTQFTQEITPVTSSNLTYVFQGLTSDGAYFVSGFFPIRSSAVALDAAQVTKDERDRIKKDYKAYISSTVQSLDTNEQSFTPSLAALDGMLTSLTISPNPLGKPKSAGTTSSSQSPPRSSGITGRAVELLNIRNAPNTHGRLLGKLSPGEAATLIGRTTDTQWIRVRAASGLVGWVSREYLNTGVDVSTLPISQ